MRTFQLVIILVAILAFGWLVIGRKPVEKDVDVGSFTVQTGRALDVLGTSSTPFGLSSNLAVDARRSVFVAKGCDRVTFGGAYLPRTTGAYANVLIEASMDEGVNYLPLSTNVAGTTEIDVYIDGGTNMGAASSGIPYIFPGDKTTTAGRGVTGTFPGFENHSFTHLRFSASELPAASTGTLWLQAACAG